jgi:hypothetical protein
MPYATPPLEKGGGRNPDDRPGRRKVAAGVPDKLPGCEDRLRPPISGRLEFPRSTYLGTLEQPNPGYGVIK